MAVGANDDSPLQGWRGWRKKVKKIWIFRLGGLDDGGISFRILYSTVDMQCVVYACSPLLLVGGAGPPKS
jgi:hypothetical protein